MNCLQVIDEIQATRSAMSVSGLRFSFTTRFPAGSLRHEVPASAGARLAGRARAGVAAASDPNQRASASVLDAGRFLVIAPPPGRKSSNSDTRTGWGSTAGYHGTARGNHGGTPRSAPIWR